MNKKGALPKPVWIIIGIVVLGIVAFFIFGTQSACTFLDTGSFTKPAVKAPTSGAIFIWYFQIQKSFLDPAFQYLFGKTFFDSLKIVAGYKGVCASVVSFLQHFILAFAALFWIALGKFLMNMLFKIFRIGNNYWAHVGASTYLASVKMIGLLVVYPALMQVALINRFIEIVTFYYFTNWFIYSLILAIYVGWLPEIIQGIIKYREYQKYQKAIFTMKAGAVKIQTAGKAR